jgi:hypothetical protein
MVLLLMDEKRDGNGQDQEKSYVETSGGKPPLSQPPLLFGDEIQQTSRNAEPNEKAEKPE